MKTFMKLFLALLVCVTLATSQAVMTQTTLTNAIDNRTRTIILGSVTGINAPSQPVANGAIDAPTGSNVTIVMIEKEAMRVTAAANGLIVSVARGTDGTRAVAHAANAVVWIGPSSYYARINPTGSCTATTETVLPKLVLLTGDQYTCPTSGPNLNTWTKQGVGETLTFTDATFFVPPTACFGKASANAGSGDGTLILDGSVPALKSSATAAANLQFSCTIFVPSRLTANKGFTITDITYLYSPQTTAPTSMVASTFKSFTAPAAATGETASSATLVDRCATCVQTPVVGSGNFTALSAGQYYSEKVALGTPYKVNNDLQGFVFTFELDQSAASAMIVTTPGLYVHGISSPL